MHTAYIKPQDSYTINESHTFSLPAVAAMGSGYSSDGPLSPIKVDCICSCLFYKAIATTTSSYPRFSTLFVLLLRRKTVKCDGYFFFF